MSKPTELVETIAAGRHLNLVKRGHWEYADRPNVSGIVGIVAVTNDGKILLVEQFRPPVNARVIELPAGLAGDIVGSETEALTEAAERELVEETGYRAESFTRLFEGPPSAGMSSEVITFFKAENLTREHAGGGDDSEDIQVHEVPLTDAESWLAAAVARDALIDPKVYAGLFFAK